MLLMLHFIELIWNFTLVVINTIIAKDIFSSPTPTKLLKFAGCLSIVIVIACFCCGILNLISILTIL